MQRVLGLAAAVAVVLLTASAASASKTSVIPLLRVDEWASSSSLNPNVGGADFSSEFSLESLMHINPDGTLKPWLAQSVSSPGKAVYVYHLRHGVKFWDGTELTAADVANSLNYMRYPAFQTAYCYASVRSVTAPSRYTVVVTLRHPDASWGPTAGVSFCAPVFERKFQLAHKATFGQPDTGIMGTGPWKVASFDPTTGAEFVANPHWWGGQVPIQRISVKTITDDTSLALAYRAGELDVAFPQGSVPGFIAAAGGVKVQTAANPGDMGFIGMNTKLPPWNDVHVRRAVAYAINRADVIRARGGYASPVSTFIPPQQLRSIAPAAQVNALVGSLPSYPFSVAKAKAELAKSAYPNGFSSHIDAYYFGATPQIDQAIAGDLAKIGIKLQVNTPSIGDFLDELTGTPNRSKVGINFNYWGAETPDPGSYPPTFLLSRSARQGGWNYANYGSPTVDGLIAQGAAGSPAKRLAAYKQLLTIVGNDVPYVPLFIANVTLAIDSHFKWTTFNPYFIDGPWALEIKPA
jgi:peptide/nickel transport system substrate-binding protein